jgi:hypothetical protein
VEAVAQRVNTAIKMNMVTKSMSSVVQGMSTVLQSTNVEKIAGVMDKVRSSFCRSFLLSDAHLNRLRWMPPQFEKQFEDLDVSSKVMEQSMSSSMAQQIPASQVEDLLKQVADENGLEFQSQLEDIGEAKPKSVKQTTTETKTVTKKQEVKLTEGSPSTSKEKQEKPSSQQNSSSSSSSSSASASSSSASSSSSEDKTNKSSSASSSSSKEVEIDEDELLQERLRRLQG